MKTFKEYTKLDEVYGTVKISGKRGRLVQHSPGEVVFVGNKKQTEKNLKQLKKDGGDGYIMQGVTIKVGEKVKGVTEVDEDKKKDALKLALAIRNFKKRGGKIDKQPENMEKWWGQLSPEDKKRAKNIAQYKKNKKK